MKAALLSFCLLLIAGFSCHLTAQSQIFENIHNPKDGLSIRHVDESAFANLETLALYINDLDNDLALLSSSGLGLKDFPKLTTINIKYNIAPESSSNEKEAVIKKLIDYLDVLKVFANAPTLKKVVFWAGDAIHLTNKEYKKLQNSLNYEEDYDNYAKINVNRSDKIFAAKIHAVLPNVTLYGYNWGW